MSTDIIQFALKPNSWKKPEAEGLFYEQLFDKPRGSFQGTHLGVPFFEVPDLGTRLHARHR